MLTRALNTRAFYLSLWIINELRVPCLSQWILFVDEVLEYRPIPEIIDFE